MQHKDVFVLESIAEFCDKIISYTAENNLDEATFRANPRNQDLCAFYCLQIGENANSLSDQFRDSHPEIDWRGVIGLRHNIAHEYGEIDPGILWSVLSEDVPELRNFCTKILEG